MSFTDRVAPPSEPSERVLTGKQLDAFREAVADLSQNSSPIMGALEYLMTHRRPEQVFSPSDMPKPVPSVISWPNGLPTELRESKINVFCSGFNQRDPLFATDLREIFSKAFEEAIKVSPGVNVTPRDTGPRGAGH